MTIRILALLIFFTTDSFADNLTPIENKSRMPPQRSDDAIALVREGVNNQTAAR